MPLLGQSEDSQIFKFFNFFLFNVKHHYTSSTWSLIGASLIVSLYYMLNELEELLTRRTFNQKKFWPEELSARRTSKPSPNGPDEIRRHCGSNHWYFARDKTDVLQNFRILALVLTFVLWISRELHYAPLSNLRKRPSQTLSDPLRPSNSKTERPVQVACNLLIMMVINCFFSNLNNKKLMFHPNNAHSTETSQKKLYRHLKTFGLFYLKFG